MSRYFPSHYRDRQGDEFFRRGDIEAVISQSHHDAAMDGLHKIDRVDVRPECFAQPNAGHEMNLRFIALDQFSHRLNITCLGLIDQS